MKKVSDNKYKQVESEAEYWKEHKKMKREISKLFRSAYSMISDPQGFVDKYENILAKYEFKGVISTEWSQEQRERLYRELNSPNEFKEWVDKGKENLKAKAKKLGVKIREQPQKLFTRQKK